MNTLTWLKLTLALTCFAGATVLHNQATGTLPSFSTIYNVPPDPFQGKRVFFVKCDYFLGHQIERVLCVQKSRIIESVLLSTYVPTTYTETKF